MTVGREFECIMDIATPRTGHKQPAISGGDGRPVSEGRGGGRSMRTQVLARSWHQSHAAPSPLALEHWCDPLRRTKQGIAPSTLRYSCVLRHIFGSKPKECAGVDSVLMWWRAGTEDGERALQQYVDRISPSRNCVPMSCPIITGTATSPSPGRRLMICRYGRQRVPYVTAFLLSCLPGHPSHTLRYFSYPRLGPISQGHKRNHVAGSQKKPQSCHYYNLLIDFKLQNHNV